MHTRSSISLALPTSGLCLARTSAPDDGDAGRDHLGRHSHRSSAVLVAFWGFNAANLHHMTAGYDPVTLVPLSRRCRTDVPTTCPTFSPCFLLRSADPKISRGSYSPNLGSAPTSTLSPIPQPEPRARHSCRRRSPSEPSGAPQTSAGFTWDTPLHLHK